MDPGYGANLMGSTFVDHSKFHLGVIRRKGESLECVGKQDMLSHARSQPPHEAG